MIITCPECETKYRYDERRFDGKTTKQVKCTSCGFGFEVANPVLEAADSGVSDEAGAGEKLKSADDSGASWNPELANGSAQSPPAEPVAVTTTPEPGPEDDSPMPPLPRDPRYSLAVIAGGQAGSVFQIHKPRIFLGRGSSMDIQLRDSEVSRRHAVLEIRDPEVSLTDLQATNGTWFNGTQIESAKLGHQDEFTLGSTTLMLIVSPVRDTP